MFISSQIMSETGVTSMYLEDGEGDEMHQSLDDADGDNAVKKVSIIG